MSLLGENIRKFRKEKGLTQKQLAELVGVKHNSVSDWERGIVKPYPDTIELLAGALGVNPSDLLGWNNPRQIKKDADKLADILLGYPQNQELLSIIETLPDDDIKLITSIAKRLCEKAGE